MRYKFIQSHSNQFNIQKLCKALSVSRSGYYEWRKRTPGKREQENEKLLDEIKKIHKDSRETYGSPRITLELHKLGYSCSRPRVARIMGRHDIYAKTKRKFKPTTTDSNHDEPISPNLLKQKFTAEEYNQIWVSDITYIRTSAGWLYLTVIIDLYNRQVVGWSMSHRLTAETTTVAALIHAKQRQQPPKGLIFHSDRGVQYACKKFRKKIAEYKMVQSMSGKGNCYDNAVAESFFKTLKTELVYFEKYITRKQAQSSIFEYIEVFYNRKRIHSTLGYKTPMEFLELKKIA